MPTYEVTALIPWGLSLFGSLLNYAPTIPQSKKLRSGDLGGHATEAPLPIHCGIGYAGSPSI